MFRMFSVVVWLAVATSPLCGFAEDSGVTVEESLTSALTQARLVLLATPGDEETGEAYVGLPEGYRFIVLTEGGQMLNLPPPGLAEAAAAGINWQPHSVAPEGASADYVCMSIIGAYDGVDNDGDGFIDEEKERSLGLNYFASRVMQDGEPIGYLATEFTVWSNTIVGPTDIQIWANALFADHVVHGNLTASGSVHILGNLPDLPAFVALSLSGSAAIVNNYGQIGTLDGITADLAARIGYTGEPETSHEDFDFVDFNGDGSANELTLNGVVRIKNGALELAGSSTIGQSGSSLTQKLTMDEVNIGDGGGDEVLSGADRIFSDNGYENGYDLGLSVIFPRYGYDHGAVFITERYLVGFDAPTWTDDDNFVHGVSSVGSNRVFHGDLYLTVGSGKSAANSFYWNASESDESLMPDGGIVGQAPGTGSMPTAAELADKIADDEHFIWYDCESSRLIVNGRVPVDGDVGFLSGHGSNSTFYYEGKGSLAAIDLAGDGIGGSVVVDANLLTETYPQENLLGLMAQRSLLIAETGQRTVMGGFYAQDTIGIDKQTTVVGALAGGYIDLGFNVPVIYWVPGLPTAWTDEHRMIGTDDSMRMIGGGSTELDVDQDDDAMPDWWEIAYGLNPLLDDAHGDLDNDGLSNITEYLIGTDPSLADSDGDGLSDGEEVLTFATDPLTADTDEDGLSDGDEVNVHGTDPLYRDSDFDGINDGDEIATYGTDPLNGDTDGDGALDGEELDAGSDPLDEGSFPTGEVWVDVGYTGEPVGTWLKPVTSLEAAEIVVLDGGIVRVAPGEYLYDSTLGALGKAYSIYTLGGTVTVGPVE